MGALLVPPEIRADEQEWGSSIAQIARGDQDALGAFYDRTSPRVYGLVIKILGDHAAADEVTLDVYTQVWRQAHTYDGNRGSPGGWLMTLARSRAIDRLRSGLAERGRLATLDTADHVPHPGDDPEESSAGNERQRLILRALSQLGPEQHEAISLAYYSGLSQSEIAAKLAVPLGTVKTRTRLALIKLRDLLAPHEEGLTV
jgi:RNA polymerase sigma-70 factor (ECF subfamily)